MDKAQKQLKQRVIFTDLDGTLLDHHTYSWQAAAPALAKAESLGIPVIPCTSKTRQETEHLVADLNLQTSFIFENGSGICSPDGAITALAPAYSEQLNTLAILKSEPRFKFVGFNDMSVADIVDATGLDSPDAANAKAREFSEPFLWQGKLSDLKAFNIEANRLGLNIISGGRFFHALAKGVSKNSALRHLLDTLGIHSAEVIALGDGDNDIPMLSAADIAIAINNPTKSFPMITRSASTALTSAPIYYSSAYGPEGWNSAILTLLEE